MQDADGQAAPGGAVRRRPRWAMSCGDWKRAVCQTPSATVPKPSRSCEPSASMVSQVSRAPFSPSPMRSTWKCGARIAASRSALRSEMPETSRCVGRMMRPGSLMLDQHHQHEVRRRFVVADLAGGAALFEIAQAGFVAMMAVGDEDRLGAEQPVTVLTTC